jgi:hypothetical protein
MAHGDHTGITKAQLAREAAEQQQFAATKMTMVTDAVRTAHQGTIDLYTDEDKELLESLKAGNIHVEGQTTGNDERIRQWSPVKFRASEDLDDITVGLDRTFTLKAQQTYKAPYWVAQHLDEQGLVLH